MVVELNKNNFNAQEGPQSYHFCSNLKDPLLGQRQLLTTESLSTVTKKSLLFLIKSFFITCFSLRSGWL